MNKDELEKQNIKLREFARWVIETAWDSQSIDSYDIEEQALELELIEVQEINLDDEDDNKEMYMFTNIVLDGI